MKRSKPDLEQSKNTEIYIICREEQYFDENLIDYAISGYYLQGAFATKTMAEQEVRQKKIELINSMTKFFDSNDVVNQVKYCSDIEDLDPKILKQAGKEDDHLYIYYWLQQNKIETQDNKTVHKIFTKIQTALEEETLIEYEIKCVVLYQ